ncbi:hypothetical protein GY45DRAFT_434976 [Cubamyces sp. BRFM 1775]|nr:hypothetical protein GY45DRAFT_434976 [Cubamyces sp. BRFM 1775]
MNKGSAPLGLTARLHRRVKGGSRSWALGVRIRSMNGRQGLGGRRSKSLAAWAIMPVHTRKHVHIRALTEW